MCIHVASLQHNFRSDKHLKHHVIKSRNCTHLTKLSSKYREHNEIKAAEYCCIENELNKKLMR